MCRLGGYGYIMSRRVDKVLREMTKALPDELLQKVLAGEHLACCNSRWLE
jgi:hypothetical protein